MRVAHRADGSTGIVGPRLKRVSNMIGGRRGVITSDLVSFGALISQYRGDYSQRGIERVLASGTSDHITCWSLRAEDDTWKVHAEVHGHALARAYAEERIHTRSPARECRYHLVLLCVLTNGQTLQIAHMLQRPFHRSRYISILSAKHSPSRWQDSGYHRPA